MVTWRLNDIPKAHSEARYIGGPSGIRTLDTRIKSCQPHVLKQYGQIRIRTIVRNPTRSICSCDAGPSYHVRRRAFAKLANKIAGASSHQDLVVASRASPGHVATDPGGKATPRRRGRVGPRGGELTRKAWRGNARPHHTGRLEAIRAYICASNRPPYLPDRVEFPRPVHSGQAWGSCYLEAVAKARGGRAGGRTRTISIAASKYAPTMVPFMAV